MNLEILHNQIAYIETQICTLQTQINTFPDGTIHIAHQGKYSKWYSTPSLNETHLSDYCYIPKSNRKLASALATKKYMSLQLNELNQQLTKLRELESLITNSPSKELWNDAAYQELLTSHPHSYNQEIQDWINSDYPRNPYHPENLIHPSVSGNILRSKSEALIDTLLFYEKIPFRYECELIINGQIKYPDFTIIHPLSGRIIYWEHYGMMDSPQYAHKNLSKQLDYITGGILPNDNLICTYETIEHPLTSDLVKRTIDRFLKQ